MLYNHSQRQMHFSFQVIFKILILPSSRHQLQIQLSTTSYIQVAEFQVAEFQLVINKTKLKLGLIKTHYPSSSNLCITRFYLFGPSISFSLP